MKIKLLQTLTILILYWINNIYHTQKGTVRIMHCGLYPEQQIFFTLNTIKFINDLNLLWIKSIPVWRWYNPVVCILAIFKKELFRRIKCDSVLIFHRYHTIRDIRHINVSLLCVLAVMVNYTIIHIIWFLIVRQLSPENIWILIFRKIYSK